MAEAKKENEAKAADTKINETPEQKADRETRERDQKENEKREKLVGGFIKDLQGRLEEYGGEDLNSILTDVKARVASLYVVAAGADMGTPTPEAVKELTETHTPYVAPATPPGRTPSANIALHVAEMDEETRSKKKSKKAA